MRNRILAVAALAATFFAAADMPSFAKGKPGGGGGGVTNPAYAYSAQVKGNQPVQLFIATFDGSATKQLTNESFTTHEKPAWSPDGTTIAYLARADGAATWIDGIWTIAADGAGSPTRIYEIDTDGYDIPAEIAWSPDGTTIAFTTGNWEIFLLDVATGGTTVALATGDGYYVQEIAWSPDSGTVVFAGSPRSSSGGADLFLLDVATGAVTNLTNTPDVDEHEPTWSADGRIAFIDSGNGGAIWVMDADGTNASQLVSAASSRKDLRWSPDAAHLSYLQSQELYRVRVSTGQVAKVLTSRFGITSQDWNPAWQ